MRIGEPVEKRLQIFLLLAGLPLLQIFQDGEPEFQEVAPLRFALVLVEQFVFALGLEFGLGEGEKEQINDLPAPAGCPTSRSPCRRP